jgi:hypothetical protein
MTALWYLAPCSLVKVDGRFRDALMMSAVRTSKTPDYFETARRYIPEGCHLHILWRGNLKYLLYYMEVRAGLSQKLRTFEMKEEY